MFKYCFDRYGDKGIQFYFGPLEQAVNDSLGHGSNESTENSDTNVRGRPLAIYLHNDRAFVGHVFAQSILSHPTVSSILNEQYLLFPWDMSNEANANEFFQWIIAPRFYDLNAALRKHELSDYPLLVT